MIGSSNSSSGGGISFNAALLVVYTPLGSIVTAEKDGTTKTSKKGIALSDRPTVEIHLFSISSSQYGTWTVTATRGTDTNSMTISVTAVEQYELYIGYHVPIGTYQEVEYLQSSGTQRISTGISGVNGVDIKFKYNKTNNNTTVFGARSSDGGSDRFLIIVYNTNFVTVPGYYFPSADTSEHSIQNGYYFNGHLFFDGIDRGASGTTGSSHTSQLFAENNKGTIAYFASARIYYAKLYKNSELVRDFYPCYRLSDSVAGMYDKVNGVFYPNNGTGTFTVGADV